MTEHTPTLIGTTALVLIPGHPRVMVGGRRAVLRPQELVLLELLARDPVRLLNTATLAKHLARHGHGKLNTTTVAVHVHRLRQRLGPLGLTIRTFRGSGYTLEPIEDRGPRERRKKAQQSRPPISYFHCQGRRHSSAPKTTRNACYARRTGRSLPRHPNCQAARPAVSYGSK